MKMTTGNEYATLLLMPDVLINNLTDSTIQEIAFYKREGSIKNIIIPISNKTDYRVFEHKLFSRKCLWLSRFSIPQFKDEDYYDFFVRLHIDYSFSHIIEKSGDISVALIKDGYVRVNTLICNNRLTKENFINWFNTSFPYYWRLYNKHPKAFNIIEV